MSAKACMHMRAKAVPVCEPLPASMDNFERLKIADIYATNGVIGMRLTERARALQGTPVVIRGYIAPAMVDRGTEFVLTKAPFPSCPFCDGLRWPNDGLPTALETEAEFAAYDQQIEVVGELDLINRNDAEEAFGLRLARLRNARWQVV